MRVLLLHPEDELPAERTGGKWDLVVDLGRAPLATYERWGAQTGGRVISLYDFARDFEDLHRVRELLQLGTGPVGGWFGHRLVGRALADDRARPSPVDADWPAGARTAGWLRAVCQPLQHPGDRAADIYRRETSQPGWRISSRHAMGAALSRCFHPAGSGADEPGFSGQVRSRTLRATTIGPAGAVARNIRLCCCPRHMSMFRGPRLHTRRCFRARNFCWSMPETALV